MTVEALLERIQAAGATLEPRGDQLRIKALAPLPDDLLAELRAHKGELVALLRGELPAHVGAWPEGAGGLHRTGRDRGVDGGLPGPRLGSDEVIRPDLRAQPAASGMEVLPVPAAAMPADPAQALETRIRFARSEDELEALVEEIQAGFDAGHLSQAQAERLTYLVIGIARQLKQGLVNVPITTQPEGERDGC